MLSLEEKKKAIVQHYIQQRKLPPTTLVQQLQDNVNIETMYAQLVEEVPYNKRIKILFNYQKEPQKWTTQHFIEHFNKRYLALAKILSQRQELQNLTSVARVAKKQEREKVSLIGMVSDKQFTKNDNVALVLEDQSGMIKAIVSKKSPAYLLARDVVFDEVLGVTGTTGNNVLFVDNILLPDVPMTTEMKKAPDEAYAIVLSCIHIGSKKFLQEEFLKFIHWIRGEVGNPTQQAIASKVEYVFVVGDIVDGVGVYPRQENDLNITDIYAQYQEIARYLRMIPTNKQIILCPGNHDAVRLGEPQPSIYPDIVKPLLELPNVTFVSNPGMVNVHASDAFPGFDVLMYHGFSYIYYGDTVESIKKGTRMEDRVGPVMKFLLQRRHLAPSHTSTLYIPDPQSDPLVIEHVPDIFLSGHLHKAAVGTYRGVTLVAASCFLAKTEYQEKFGVEPEPCRVPLINLRTREVKMLRFEK